jgi:hypothetical protein
MRNGQFAKISQFVGTVHGNWPFRSYRSCEPLTIETSGSNQEFYELQNPKTSDNLISLRREIEKTITQGGELDSRCKLRIQKIANAAENAFAEREILLDENLLLFEQNNDKSVRQSIKATVVGSARVLSYEDIFHQARYVSFVSSAIPSKSGLALNHPLIGCPRERYKLNPSQPSF